MLQTVAGLVADANCVGQLALLVQVLRADWRQEVWEALQLPVLTFADLGLPAEASDRVVWETCQRAHVILLTANRNEAGPDSLEATLRHANTPASLPVFTLANDQRVLRERAYAEAVAGRLREVVFDIEPYRSMGRLYLP